MNRGFRVHGLRTGLVTALLFILVFTGFTINKAVEERQQTLIAQKQEERNQAEATRLVEGLLPTDTREVSTSIANLKEFRTWADPQLKQAFEDSAADSNAKLHAGLALVAEGQTVDPTALKFLRDRLLTVTPGQFGSVRELLAPHKAELIPEYWKRAMDDQRAAAQRFHAACALAAYDPEHANWNDETFRKFVAEQLVAVTPVYIGQYQELLRPVSGSLVPPLGEIFKDPARGELAKTLATTLLSDYAASDPETLTELVLVANAIADKSLFPILQQQHQQTAVKTMEAVLDRRLEPDWKDDPLDPTWTEPSAAIRAKIEAAHGLISERYAFCQDMQWNAFQEVAETLRASGYRPTRVRPQRSRHSPSAAASLPNSAVPEQQAASPESTANTADGTRSVPATLVAAIWTRDGLKWQLQPSVTTAQLPAPDALGAKDGMLLSDLAALPSADPAAEPQFVAVWSEPTAADEQCRVLIDLSGVDLTAAQAQLTEQGFASQSCISVRTDNAGQRLYTAIISNQGAPSELRPAYAGFELVEQPQWDVAVAPPEKLADPLEQFRQQMAQIEKLPPERLDEPQVREIRAAAHYQLGKLDAALADLDFLIGKEISTASVLQYRTLTLARLGKADEAKASLEQYMATETPPSFKLYVQIQVPAWLGEFEPASAQLESAITASGQSADDLYNVAYAAALCSQAFVAKDVAQSQQLAARTITLLQQMVANGYKNVQQLKSDADFASLHADPRFLALLETMEAPAKYAALWRADVEFESKLLAAVPMTSVVEQLKPLLAAGWRPFAMAVDSSDVTRRRSLILGLGEFAKAKLLTADQQASVIADRRWYLTKRGQSRHHSPSDATAAELPASPKENNTALTFAILDASDEFLMGSPVSEAERYGGPTGTYDIRHRRRIGRNFAIGTHEITVAQFQAFRKQHDFDRTKARELDAPANVITWYDAAAYCNWLSDQEGIPREHWCYDPDQPFQEGMSLVPDYLQRTGYRLPSEAEWEYACRASTTTARYFGETETLLGEYGWYTKTSGDKWMLPVGTLRPNGAGLFDMQGNVTEWCQDQALLFDTDSEWMGDKEQTGKIGNSQSRVLRGGSFINSAANVRSANRNNNQPDNRNNNNGFRRACLGCATKRNLAQKILGEFYSGRGTHRLTRLGEEAFSRLHFVQPSSSPSRVKRSLPLTTKSSSEKSPNFLETAICRAPQSVPECVKSRSSSCVGSVLPRKRHRRSGQIQNQPGGSGRPYITQVFTKPFLLTK